MESLTCCVPCLFGLEGLAAAELRRLGMDNVRAQDRRVFFDGAPRDIARANLNLRTGERVMILLAAFEAKSFEALYQGVRPSRWRTSSPGTARSPSRATA